jgi:branched-chain amino acid transport system substrate-binding protein
MNILRSRRLHAALAAGVVLSLAACGGGGSGSSSSASSSGGGSSLPSTIKIVGTEPETGPAAFAGLSAEKGYKLAVKQINAQHVLGQNTTLDVSFQDTKGQIPTAAASVSSVLADKSVSAVLGSVSSQEAVA